LMSNNIRVDPERSELNPYSNLNFDYLKRGRPSEFKNVYHPEIIE